MASLSYYKEDIVQQQWWDRRKEAQTDQIRLRFFLHRQQILPFSTFSKFLSKCKSNVETVHVLIFYVTVCKKT